MKLLVVIFAIFLVLVFGLYAYAKFLNPKKTILVPSPSNSTATSPASSPNKSNLALPIAEFKTRVIKKPFGIYISPQNSPVQPERFTGYHTGADAEYGDVTSDVPVYAINNSVVTYSQWTSGYGGVLILKVDINGNPHSVLYGHLRPSSLPPVGKSFTKGDQIAVLGTAYSTETDGERRHLHFAILSNSRVDVKGYVQQKSELSGWLDPLSLY